MSYKNRVIEQPKSANLIRRSLRTSSALGLTTALLLSNPAFAEQVTLRAPDGSADITANLLDFDGSRYVLETTIGEIQIDASQVECVAGACPTIASVTADGDAIGISATDHIVSGLLPALIDDFAAGVDGTATGNDGRIDLASANGAAIGSIDLMAGDTSYAFGQLASGTSVLSITDRPLTADEGDVFALQGRLDPTEDDRQAVIGLDAMVIVTAQNNPVNAISVDNLARVFSGRITNWSQLGGPDAPITIYAPELNSSVAASFQEQLMQPSGRSFTANMTVLDGDAEVSQAVADDPFGIGFVNFSGQTAGRTVSILGSCGIQTPPTEFTIKTEEYPFTNRLFVARAADDMSPFARDFLAYLDTQDGQAVVSEAGFIDKSVALVGSEEQGRRYAAAMWPSQAQTNLRELGNMVQELLPAQRVSLTFRFLPGSAQLEARGLEDLQRLADLFAEGEVFANKELLLVGFTDSAGSSSANRLLSQQRANRVANILQTMALPGSMDDTPVRTLGYGEASPLTCNDTDIGRSTNRRVEVWVRDIVADN